MTQEIDANDFIDIEYENNDVDTDRGVMRDRVFFLLFKDATIGMGEEDFNLLLDKIKPYLEGRQEEMEMWKNLNKKEKN